MTEARCKLTWTAVLLQTFHHPPPHSPFAFRPPSMSRQTPFNQNSGYSNLEPSSPVSPRYGNAYQQSAGQFAAGGAESYGQSPTRGRYDDVRGSGSHSGSSLDDRGPGAIATGQIGGGYGPYSFEGAGSSSSLNRPARDSSLGGSSSTSSLAGPSANRYTPRQSSQPNPFANPPSQIPSSASSSSSHRLTTNPHAAAAAAAATPLTGITRAAPVFTARDALLDDKLHNPSPNDDRVTFHLFSARGILNMGMILILVAGLVTLFAGWPIIQWVTSKTADTYGAYGIGGINSTGQVPDTGLPGLIDKHTPNAALTRTGFDGKKYVLMFSDEFETDGRTFVSRFCAVLAVGTLLTLVYTDSGPEMIPYGRLSIFTTGSPAISSEFGSSECPLPSFRLTPRLHRRWYDPDAVTTKDGNLVITLSEEPIHGLNFRSDESSPLLLFLGLR